MPLKLIGFIIFIVLIFTFIGFNLDNHTNINLWINEKGHFEDVSVIIVVFCAYLLGLLSTIPFWFNRSRKKNRQKKSMDKKEDVAASSSPAEPPIRKKHVNLPFGKKKTLEDRNS